MRKHLLTALAALALSNPAEASASRGKAPPVQGGGDLAKRLRPSAWRGP